MLLEQEGLRWHTFRTRHCITLRNVLRTDRKKVKDYKNTNMYRDEVSAFSALVSGKETSIATGSDGYEVVRIVEDAFLSDTKS